MRRGGKAFVFALALVLAAGARAEAQEEEDAPPPEEEEQPAPAEEEPASPPEENAATTYQGVAPGAGAPAVRRPRRGPNPLVTWLGFQPQPGGAARIFVQLDREVAHAQKLEEGALIISLEGARVAHTNTRRFLDTRFFDSAVERIAIEEARRKPGERRRRGRGLELVIRFKSPAEARRVAAQMTPAKDGFTYLIVDVPRAARAARP